MGGDLWGFEGQGLEGEGLLGWDQGGLPRDTGSLAGDFAGIEEAGRCHQGEGNAGGGTIAKRGQDGAAAVARVGDFAAISCC